MDFGFIPIAEASVTTLMKSINRVIINPIIFFLFALAMVYFLYGVARYLLSPDNEEVRKNSKSQMLYGVIGLFIMVAVFGIMNLILNTTGANKKIKVQNTGNYEIVDSPNGYEFNTAGDNLNPREVDLNSTDGVDLRSARDVDFTNVPTIKPSDFNKSPFLVKYMDNISCWHKEVHATGSTEYKALQTVKLMAKNDYESYNGPSENSGLPWTFGILVAYDQNTKTYHAWMDARAPINGGNSSSCVLPVKSTEELPIEDYVLRNPFTTTKEQSSGLQDISLEDTPLTKIYTSDDLFYRSNAFGSGPLLDLARDLAIKKAFELLGIEAEVNGMTIVHPTARILEERYITNPDTGDYEYWVAVESSKERR